MTSITIPTNAVRYAAASQVGHFESPAIITYAGSPKQYKIGGWDASGQGRLGYSDEKIAGPQVFVFGATVTVDANGHGAREYAAMQAKGLIVNVKGGEVLEIAGTKYMVEPGKRYLSLTAVAAA